MSNSHARMFTVSTVFGFRLYIPIVYQSNALSHGTKHNYSRTNMQNVRDKAKCPATEVSALIGD